MYFIGLDLGQRRDFSASAVIQRQKRMAVWSPNPACSLVVWIGNPDQFPHAHLYPRRVSFSSRRASALLSASDQATAALKRSAG